MQISITRASLHVLDAVSSVCSGTVHSVYRRTINLSLDAAGTHKARLIALQDLDCVLSPLSLCTSLSADRMHTLPVEEGQIFLAEPDDIVIVTPKGMIDFKIDLRHAPCTAVQDLNLSGHPALPLTDIQLSDLTVCVSRLLPASPSGSFAQIYGMVQNGDSLILDRARTCCDRASALFRAGDAVGAAEILCSGLIGLGMGLTPGGDDFLCGLLAGLCLRGAFPGQACTGRAASCSNQLQRFARALCESIPAYLHDTDDISAAFLQCAAEGQFSEAVFTLTACTDPDVICDSFSRIGHSSGFDTLAGIFYALRLS